MATIRKRNGKYQAQVRRHGQAPISKTFHQLKDAQEWARQAEVKADRYDLPADPSVLKRTTLKHLVERYRDEITPKKRRAAIETIVLNAFLRDDICALPLSALTPESFVKYVDQRLKKVKQGTLKRDLGAIHNMFETARTDWGLPIRDNPLTPVTCH